MRKLPSTAKKELIGMLQKDDVLDHNWRGVADRLLDLSIDQIKMLEEKDSKMKGVFQLMEQQLIPIRRFVEVLDRLNRLDVIELLKKAGLAISTDRKTPSPITMQVPGWYFLHNYDTYFWGRAPTVTTA